MWRGETSAFLHRVAPERRLYLFDTFKGSHSARPVRRAWPTPASGTPAQRAVRAGVRASANVVLRPGYVPDTLAGLEDETFAFVLLDLDLLGPTVASLEFFYPRIAAGRLPRRCTTTTTRSPTGRASARSTRSWRTSPSRLVELGDVWGSALIRRVGLSAAGPAPDA